MTSSDSDADVDKPRFYSHGVRRNWYWNPIFEPGNNNSRPRATDKRRTTKWHRNPSEPTMTGPTARISARSPRPRRRFNMATRLTARSAPWRFRGGRPSAGLVRAPDGSSPSSPSAQSSGDDRPSVAENKANTVMTQLRVMAHCTRTFSVR